MFWVDQETQSLKEHLIDELDYVLVPTEAWNKLVSWYSCLECQRPIVRKKDMRTLFNIPSEKETRLWNKYMSNTYEQLNKPDSTVQDAGLFQGQVV
ncbi:hypothetical protein F7725_017123 [Dissostichus mawsoni]|uniref:ubiquitinyl hydrolase 1 n=1 Tax=Dissostichus mawsoni TaxID=36200 RepID=A0A7J5Z489_DISMA|nr:hypothetical protein F7725_017123 [Dissostichus mawsoni]